MTPPTVKLKCTALILDLDGTISDPSVGITRCFNHALQSHGFATVSDSIIAREIGPPLDETFFKLAPGISASDIDPLVSTYRERYSDLGYAENTLYPDIPSVLDQLRNSGLKLGVCTSKRQDFAERILTLFGIMKYFSFVDGGDIGVTKGAQLRGLIKSGMIDDQAIMVGDRSIDIISAQENGLRSIGVLWGFGDYAELADASPTCILEKVLELPGIVD
jgi:phosphoglycolate phosphatase